MKNTLNKTGGILSFIGIVVVVIIIFGILFFRFF